MCYHARWSRQPIVRRTPHLSLGGECAFGQLALPPQSLDCPLVAGNVRAVVPFELSPMRVQNETRERRRANSVTCDGVRKLHAPQNHMLAHIAHISTYVPKNEEWIVSEPVTLA